MAHIHKWKQIFIKKKVKICCPVEQDTGYDLFGVCVYMCVCVSDRGGGVDVGIWITGVYKNRTRTQQQ